MADSDDEDLAVLTAPSRLWRRSEVLDRPSPVPAEPGVYAWWFDRAPGGIFVDRCLRLGDLTLLYIGISPKRPPQNGRAPSRGHLRQRIRTHYSGNAEGSTLRKTLGCLLAEALGIELRRVGSGGRRTFVAGEAELSLWMQEHARVSWVLHDQPWALEGQAIAALDLPLNLDGNGHNAFYLQLKQARAQHVAKANQLPVVANPGRSSR